MKLKSWYVKICEKTGRRGGNTDSAESNSDNSGNSLELYDGFTGNFDMLQVSNSTSVYLKCVYVYVEIIKYDAYWYHILLLF